MKQTTNDKKVNLHKLHGAGLITKIYVTWVKEVHKFTNQLTNQNSIVEAKKNKQAKISF